MVPAHDERGQGKFTSLKFPDSSLADGQVHDHASLFQFAKGA